MRTLFIVGALMLSIPSANAQRSKPAQPRVEVGKAKLSEEDRRRVLEQMVELSQKQQVQLEAALQSEREVQSQLVRATNELVDAGTRALALQKAIDAQTDDLNKALADVKEWKAKHEEARKKLNWWRWMAAGISTLGLIYIFGPMLLRFVKPT